MRGSPGPGGGGPALRRAAAAAGFPRRRLALAILSLVLLVSSGAAPASAFTVFTEGRAPVAGGDLSVAQRSALALALSRAVEAVLARHVPAPELRSRSRELRDAFLARPLPYIQRYSISYEGAEGEEFVVALEADVARDGVLARLGALGIGVHVLSARPRILLVPLGGAAATAVAQGLRGVLDAQGYTTRTFPGDPSASANEATAARWATDLGCHVAFVVLSGRAGDGAPEEISPAPRARASAAARGWIVEARRGDVLGRSEATAAAEAEDAVAAAARAARRAGERLASDLLNQLERSGWGPGEGVEVLDLAVQDLPGPSVIEAIGRALPSVTEVRSASLREVGYGSAVWRLETVDAGLGPEALVGALSLPRGRLAWRETVPAVEGRPGLLRAEWVER